LLDGKVGEESFTRERIASPEIAELQGKIRCVFDPKVKFHLAGLLAADIRPSAMTIMFTDGTRLKRETIAPRGSPLNPLSDEELRAKFEAWTGPSLDAARKEQIVGLVRDLEVLDDVSRLARLL
jgi:2-methylcitrate dehydratase PrpD